MSEQPNNTEQNNTEQNEQQQNILIRSIGGNLGLWLLANAMVAGGLLLAGYWVITFVAGTVIGDPAVADNVEDYELSPIYVNFRADVDEWVSAQAYIAMGAYQRQYEYPQNVRVLTNLTTQEINGYMLNHFVAGLHVGCVYCHSIEPDDDGLYQFHLYEWGDTDEINAAEQNKYNALRHLQMVQDLNINWIGNLDELTDEKQPSGSQITCATCHNGVAKMNPWPEEQDVLPDNFRLPLAAEYNHEPNVQSILNVNARDDISLETVQYQQQVMYHMNSSLNVGCTHCHNSRYFPSQEVPSFHYALNMLAMTQYITLEYGDSMVGDDGEIKESSCSMCHYGNIIPNGAVRSVDFMPDVIVDPDVAEEFSNPNPPDLYEDEGEDISMSTSD